METTKLEHVITITIPCLPPSYNSMYEIIYGQRIVRLKPEAKRWASTAACFMPPCDDFKNDESSLYEVRVTYHGKWRTSNGNLRERDVRNYEKLITDTVFKRYGVSDKRIWRSVVEKAEADTEKVVYEIYKITEE